MPNRYKNIKSLVSNNGFRYRSNAVYPDIPESDRDIYVVTSVGDRYDKLAQQYYGDSTLWWIIATANSSSNRSNLIPTPGTQIRIPYNKQEVINSFNNLNRTR